MTCTQLRFTIDQVEVEQSDTTDREEARDLADFEGTEPRPPHVATLRMEVKGKAPISHLITSLADIRGVIRVGSVSDDTDLD